MLTAKKNLYYLLFFLTASFILNGCSRKKTEEKEITTFYDENGNHESPHPHAPDIGKSKPEPMEEIVRVRDSLERKKMERYIANYIQSEDIVTTIVLPSGDTCDCIAIERQPALKRSELAGHKINYEPPVLPKELQGDQSSNLESDPASQKQLTELKQEYGSNGKLCPEKTIPILRLTMEILDNFETLDDFFRAHPPHNVNGPTSLHQYATARFTGDNWGGQSTLNVWAPYTERSGEFSLSQIAVARGSGNDRETVEVGWQKYRDLYGDYRPRLFIYFTPDNYGSGGCYNLNCSGFVQIDNRISIGGGFTNISAHPHPSTSWEFTIRWQRHDRTGDWWLKYGEIWVGYYPSNLFDNNGLRPRGSRVSFYGEIIDDTPESGHTRTDMGSGHFPSDGFSYAAYQRTVRTITTGTVWNIRPMLDISRTDSDCYDIILHNSSGSWESYFYFGGPGYNSHCQ